MFKEDSTLNDTQQPQVYLNAAAALGVDASRCVALEDSLTGVLAAKAARMRCIAVPEPCEYDRPQFASK
jgi:sugar-phosphatase